MPSITTSLLIQLISGVTCLGTLIGAQHVTSTKELIRLIDLTSEAWTLFVFIFGAFTMAVLFTIIVLIAAAILALVSKIRDRSRPVEARGLRYDNDFVALLKHIVRWLTRKHPRSEYRILTRAIARSGGACGRAAALHGYPNYNS